MKANGNVCALFDTKVGRGMFKCGMIIIGFEKYGFIDFLTIAKGGHGMAAFFSAMNYLSVQDVLRLH